MWFCIRIIKVYGNNSYYAKGSNTQKITATSISTLTTWSATPPQKGTSGQSSKTVTITVDLNNYSLPSNYVIIVTGASYTVYYSDYGSLSGDTYAATFNYNISDSNILTITAKVYYDNHVWYEGSVDEGWRCIGSAIKGAIYLVTLG